MVISEQISLSTHGNSELSDITGDVSALLEKNDIINGIVTIFVPGSTGAITTIEFEKGAVTDLQQLLDDVAPPDKNYFHNQAWGDGNGHSHLRSALLGPSITVPFINKKMTLGTWQQIVFIDCDNRPRQRTLVVQIMGD